MCLAVLGIKRITKRELGGGRTVTLPMVAAGLRVRLFVLRLGLYEGWQLCRAEVPVHT